MTTFDTPKGAPKKPQETPKVNPAVENLKTETLVEKYAHEGLSETAIKKAIQDIDTAMGRLKQSSAFRKQYGNLNPYDVLPIMIKESLLDNSRMSRTGALGYFQLKGDAIQDAHESLRKLGIKKIYNPKDPVENCILGIIYFENTEYRLKNETKNNEISLPFSLMSYNAGVGRVTALIKEYRKENTKGNILEWDHFSLWLAKKLEPSAKEKIEYSKEYNIQYKNYFSQDWTKDETEIQIGTVKIKKSKIQESINYVEKIYQISKVNHKRPKPTVEKLKGKASEVQKPSSTPSVSTEKSSPQEYDKTHDAFHGEGRLNQAFYSLKQTIGINKNYRQIEAKKGDGVSTLLRNAGIPPTKENINIFLDINDLDSEIIKLHSYYLLPNIDTKILPQASVDQKPTVSPASKPSQPPISVAESIEKERQSRNFYTWLNTIEVKNNSLKGKTFILDPGHGGGDPGAVPIVYKDGIPVPYVMSDIKGESGKEQVVKNGAGDNALRVVEARVVMDVTYRLAKQLRENGAEIKITHYFQNGLDETTITETSQTHAPGLLDEMQNYDTWGDGTGGKFSELSKDGIHKRVDIRNAMVKKIADKNSIYFISLHADRMPGKDKKVGMNILYESEKNLGQKSFAYQLAASMDKVRNEQVGAGTRKKGIFILNKREGALDQNVLIELGNMDNPNTAYALRTPKTRQDYADGIFRGLHYLAKNK